MAFKELIADLQGVADGAASTLAKSATPGGDAGDQNIADAGATGGDSGDGGEGSASTTAGVPGDGDAGAAPGAVAGDEEESEEGEVVKSFEVTLEDGKKFQAMDATDLLKSVHARVADVEQSAGQALGLCVTMIKSLVADNVVLADQIKKLSGTGGGRQAVLAILPKNAPVPGNTLTKSEPVAMNGQDFLMKAETAFNLEKISGRDLALAESHINRGEPVPARLIQAVMSATSGAAV